MEFVNHKDAILLQLRCKAQEQKIQCAATSASSGKLLSHALKSLSIRLLSRPQADTSENSQLFQALTMPTVSPTCNSECSHTTFKSATVSNSRSAHGQKMDGVNGPMIKSQRLNQATEWEEEEIAHQASSSAPSDINGTAGSV